jgi:hypothetical protein
VSLITIIQGAARRVNYPQPTVAIGTTDPNIALLIDCAQDAGDDAVERVNWQSLKLQTPASFLGDGVTAAFPLPVGFQALSPSDVFVSNLYPTWKLPGPVAEGDLIRLKALPMAIPVHVWRQVGASVAGSGMIVPMIEFFPVLGVGETVTYVYAAKGWITNFMGVQYAPPVWQADSDLSLIAERLIRLGAVWRWKRRKGFDYSEEMNDYEGALDRLGGQEDTAPVISMSDDIGPIDTWPGIITDNSDHTY